MSETVPLGNYLSSLGASLTKIFFDIDFRMGEPLVEFFKISPLVLAVIAIEFLAFKSLVQDKKNRSIAIFFAILIAAVITPTIGLDLILGGKRALSTRYHIFAFLIVQMVVIQYLSKLIISEAPKRLIGIALICILVFAGLFSEFRMSNAQTWWSKSYDSNAYDIAAHITEPEESLLISNHTYHLISLCRYLPPNVLLTGAGIWKNEPKLQMLKNIFLFRATDSEVEDFERRNAVTATFVTKGLWRIDPKTLDYTLRVPM
jgi:hypothetical protein